jgi:uncharacterized protein YjbJ (UPF0337 family)
MGGLKKQVEGAGKVAMGKAQKGAGKAIGDAGMEARGAEKEVAGQAEMNLGKVQEQFRDREKRERKGH